MLKQVRPNSYAVKGWKNSMVWTGCAEGGIAARVLETVNI
jgi:hypothetical protein